MKKKIMLFIIILQQIFIIFLMNYYNIYLVHKLQNLFIFKKYNNNYNIEKSKIDYDNNIFVILRRLNCLTCGLFSNYNVYLGCIRKYIAKGFIPIIDQGSFSNIFNGFIRKSSINPWEIFFSQPFNYTLRNILKYGKKIKYVECRFYYGQAPSSNIFLNNVLMNYWHNIANNYLPIKGTIITESNIIIKRLFNNNNILGVLIRGTDYIAKKPKGHPIPPKVEIVIKDVQIMDKRNNYNYIFITTEDDRIREKFIKKFNTKISFYKYKHNINYNYNNKLLLAYNNNIKGNIEFMKVYLINIIILSKCIDIITARTSGAIGAFIITNGFRNKKIYYLGKY